ncbi:hypothetical protein [Geminocystis sp.]|uniref:hypothetical protein n=1 Tax=Geminocystis sp. TaxID=2664100 RepID=UPI00359333A9
MNQSTVTSELENKVYDYAMVVKNILDEMVLNENIDNELLLMFEDLVGGEIRFYQRTLIKRDLA